MEHFYIFFGNVFQNIPCMYISDVVVCPIFILADFGSLINEIVGLRLMVYTLNKIYTIKYIP